MNQINWLLLLIILTSTSIHRTTSLDYSCSNTTAFANNTAYQTNLNTLLYSLSSNSTNNPSGFYQTTVTTTTATPETIYGQYLCRGDVNTTLCNDCVRTATTVDLPTSCPNTKNAIIWYDECTVRYSNASFFGRWDLLPAKIYWHATSIIGNATAYMETLDNMISNVIANQAAEGGPVKKFATDFVNFSIVEPIYGLGQCVPDLSPFDCYLCLNASLGSFRASPGGRFLAPSCIVRYETYQHFNLSYLPQPPSPLPSQPPILVSPPSDINSNPLNRSRGSKGKKKVLKILVPVIAAIVLVIAIVFSICISRLKEKPTKADDISRDTKSSDSDWSVDSLQYDLATLVSATNNFSIGNKIGEGGFGSVYKGVRSNGDLIAVKRLSASSSQGILEFKTEVLLVSKLQHRNLVRLLGFCYTGQEKLLVYEYVANKSLDTFLFDDENRRQLDWQRRYNILKGIARGLLYLHHDSQLRIIHRDLKASNILLDADMNAKISDFGTSRIFGVEETNSIYTNRVVGTCGYMAPEYVIHGRFSIKSDAYSFGVLVLEIISGSRNGSHNQYSDSINLLSHAWKKWEARTPTEFVDPMIRDSCVIHIDEVIRCIHLGLLCVQESVEDRPTMANVALALDSYTVTLPVPHSPAVFVASRALMEPSHKNVNESWKKPTRTVSINDLSISEQEPR